MRPSSASTSTPTPSSSGRTPVRSSPRRPSPAAAAQNRLTARLHNGSIVTPVLTHAVTAHTPPQRSHSQSHPQSHPHSRSPQQQVTPAGAEMSRAHRSNSSLQASAHAQVNAAASSPAAAAAPPVLMLHPPLRSYSTPSVRSAASPPKAAAAVTSATPYHAPVQHAWQPHGHIQTAATSPPSSVPADLVPSLRAVLPLCRLPTVTLAQLISGAASQSDEEAAAVHAALHIAAAPRGGMTLSQQEPQVAGSLHRLLSGLLWVLEQCTPGEVSVALVQPTLAALNLLTRRAELRLPLLHAGALRIIARHALVRGGRTDGATAAAAPLTSALQVLLALTSAPFEQALHPAVAALINQLGATVIAGPSDEADTDAAAGTPFLLSLALLANLAAANSEALAFIKSNSSTATGVTSLSGVSAISTSSTVSSTPLRSLYRRLVSCLSASSMGQVLHALRLVAHMAINDTAGTNSSASSMESRLFHSGNSEHTFQLAFNLIGQAADRTNGEVDALEPAIDILTTLMTSPSLLAAMQSYSSLQASVRQLVSIAAKAAASASKSDSCASVALPLLTLLTQLASSAPLSDVMCRAMLLSDGECTEQLVSVLPSCPEASVARAALHLLCTLVERAGGAGGDADGSDGSDAITHSSLLQSTFLAYAPSSLALLARSLRADSWNEARQADEQMQHEQELVELTLRADPSEQHSPMSLLARSLSAGAVSTTVTSAPTPPASDTFAAASRLQASRTSLLVSVAHLFQRLIRSSEHVRSGVSAAFDWEDARVVVTSLLAVGGHTSDAAALPADVASPGRTRQHHEELFAMLHLLSLFCLDPASDARRSLQPFLASLLSSAALLGQLAGCSLALTEPQQRRSVEDALYVLHHYMTSSSSPVTSKRKHALPPSPLPVDPSALAALAEGLQRYNSTTTRDASTLQQLISAEHARCTHLASALSDTRASAHTAAQAISQREREWQRRLADAEARIAGEQSTHDSALREQAERHSEELSLAQARIADLEASLRLQSASSLSRVSSLEGELAASEARGAACEARLAEQSARYQAVVTKLSEAGQAYEAQRTYGERLASENAQLRSRAQEQLAALSAQLAQSEQQLHASRAQSGSLTLRVEDAYAKLVLLDRALSREREALSQTQATLEQRTEQAKQLSTSLVSEQAAHAQAVSQLRQCEAQLDGLASELDAAQSVREEVEGRLRGTEAALQQSDAQARAAAARCTQLDEAVRIGDARIVELQRQAAELQQRAAEQAQRLEAAEEQLRQHHQLTAMIHKLSGQAAIR